MGEAPGFDDLDIEIARMLKPHVPDRGACACGGAKVGEYLPHLHGVLREWLEERAETLTELLAGEPEGA